MVFVGGCERETGERRDRGGAWEADGLHVRTVFVDRGCRRCLAESRSRMGRSSELVLGTIERIAACRSFGRVLVAASEVGVVESKARACGVEWCVGRASDAHRCPGEVLGVVVACVVVD